MCAYCVAVNASCMTYNTPQRFSHNRTTYDFICEPLPQISPINITSVRWRKFRDFNQLSDFQSGGTGFESAIIQTDDAFTVEGSMNETLVVTNSGSARAVAYYFVPSFVEEGSDIELVTAETIIYGMQLCSKVLLCAFLLFCLLLSSFVCCLVVLFVVMVITNTVKYAGCAFQVEAPSILYSPHKVVCTCLIA